MANSPSSGKMGRPAGRTPYPNGHALSGRNLVSAARSKRTDSNYFRHRNGSVRWRCPKFPASLWEPAVGHGLLVRGTSVDGNLVVQVLESED
jgi:hypothetical protein